MKRPLYSVGFMIMVLRFGLSRKDNKYSTAMLTNAAEYYKNHRDYLSNLFLHTTGYMSFVRNMSQINYRSLKQKIQTSAKVQNISTKTDMYIRLYCHGTVALTCDWLLGEFEADAQTLAEIYESTLPPHLRQYLF